MTAAAKTQGVMLCGASKAPGLMQRDASDRTEIRRLSEKLDDAFNAFATDNGDGFGSRDLQGAYEYREEGYALAEQAFRNGAPEGAEDFIEACVEAFAESARYLIACAAAYRLAELGEHRTYGVAA